MVYIAFVRSRFARRFDTNAIEAPLADHAGLVELADTFVIRLADFPVGAIV